MIFRKLLLITSIFPFFVLARNTYFISIKSLKINDINKLSSIKEIYDTSLYFKKNRYQFQDISHPLTQKITNYGAIEMCQNMILFMNEYPISKLQLLGYAEPTEKHPKKLSKLRVLAVKTYLIEKGISSERIEIKYFGADDPINLNDTKFAQALHRRFTFKIKTKI